MPPKGKSKKRKAPADPGGARSPRQKKTQAVSESRENFLMEPCPIRQISEEPFPAGQKATLAVLLARHLLTGQGGTYIKLPYDADAVRNQMSLPMLLDMSNADVGNTSSAAPRRVYQPQGLVRDVVPSAVFEDKFRETGFVPTQNILLVPILTEEEQKEWTSGEDAFLAKMSTTEWLSDVKRNFWVCDGATRWTLAKKYNMALHAMFLRPDICVLSASTIASGHNEGRPEHAL